MSKAYAEPATPPLPPPAAGFAYLMLQRYLDAAKCFNTVLTYIAK